MNPLAELKDIQLPEAASFWPLAWGWWALIVMTLCLLSLAAWSLYGYVSRRKIKKLALQELAQFDVNDKSIQFKINALLKRVCMHYFPHHPIAGLYGKEWTAFLVSQLPVSQQVSFNDGFQSLQDTLYSATTTQQSSAIELARSWIQTCLPAKGKKQAVPLSEGGSHV